ncbi:zinc finger, CCHC-type containing protein [Tanacetum coccineum]|uniref:Zinc finger, CCHC-type containing protein n=1 Tax=Tanacetum coccineum TaxID=301880 RepID=A0ABQ5BFI3_9ASTR
MAAAAMKHMDLNFSKLDKFEGVDFRRWQKKMHFLISSMSVVYVLTTPIPEDGDDATVKQIWRRAKWDNDDYVCRGLILNGMSDPLFDIYQSVESFKELWDSLDAKYMDEDASSKKFLVSNFTNYKMTDKRPVMKQYNELLDILGRFTQHLMNMDEAIKSSVNMVEHNNSTKYNDNKGKHKRHDNTRADPNKNAKPTCWKCGKTGHIKRDCKGVNVGNKANGSGTSGSGNGSVPLKGQNMFNKSFQVYYVTYVSEAHFVQDDDVAWWIDSGATTHVCKDRCWFKIYESLNDGSILHMGNESTTLHARLGHVHFKRMQDMSKDGLIPAFDMDTEKGNTCMLNKITKKPFQDVKCKTEVLELIHSDLCDLHSTPSLGNKKYFVTFIDDASRTDRGGLSQGFWGEAMLTGCYLLNRVPNKRNMITPYELWAKRKPNLNYLRVWGCRAVVRLPDSKLKTLGKKGIECIIVRYAKHSKAFRFYVIEPNDLVSINSIIESRDAIFDENRFSSVPRPNQKSLKDGTEDIGVSVVPEKVTEEGFRQKSGIDYFDTYAPVARISTIRLLIAMASIHNLIIHQIDVKTAFLNGELEEEVYMNQPQGFIMPGNENKVCKLIKSLYGLKQAPKQWHQKFDEVVFSNGYLLNQADKCVYRKFDETSNGVIICLYVDDMLIFGTDQVQVALTKDFLSSRFSMKDIGKADVILVLEGYTDASWISNTKDNSSTSGWVFLLGGGAISWASKKQTCISGSTMKSEFVALAAAS